MNNLYKIPSGDRGARTTVVYIRELINSGRKNLRVRNLAEQILSRGGFKKNDPVSQLGSLFQWVKANIGYLADPYQVEFIRGADKLIDSGFGDCDDFTVLLGSLSESIGIPVGIKIVETPSSGRFSHVYPVAMISGSGLAMDATIDQPMGYEIPEIKRSEIYMEKKNMQTVKGVYDGLMGRLGAPPVVSNPVDAALYQYEGAVNRYLDVYFDIQAGNYSKYGVMPGGKVIAEMKLKSTKRNMEIWGRKVTRAEDILAAMIAQRARSEPVKPPAMESLSYIEVPKGSFRMGEFPTLTKLDKYGVRGRAWPGVAPGSPGIPSGQEATWKVVDVRNKNTSIDLVSFKMVLVPAGTRPPEPKIIPPTGGTDRPLPYHPPVTDCRGYTLLAGQLVAANNQFKLGKFLGTLWGSRFAKTSPSGKEGIVLGQDQRFALRIIKADACSDLESIFTAQYQVLDIEPVSAPEPFEPPPDVVIEAGAKDIYTKFEELRTDIDTLTPGETRPVDFLSQVGAIPAWAWFAVAGVVLLKR